MAKTLRQESRRPWFTTTGETPTPKQVQLGCLLRIADAAELMAKNHADLVREHDYHKRHYANEQAISRHQARRIAALRGVITKMNKRNFARILANPNRPTGPPPLTKRQ